MERRYTRRWWSALCLLAWTLPAHGAIISSGILTFSAPNGLAAEAEFSFDTAISTILNIRLRNISTTDGGFGNSGQILTTISWDFGAPGFNSDAMILSGTVVIGPNSQSLNFNGNTALGPGANVSGEWGFGNMDGTGSLTNFVSATAALATRFGGPNVVGPGNIDGPEGGLVANPLPIPLGGLGAIQDEVLIELVISQSLTDLGSILGNGIRVEFGSDAFFITIPAPGSVSVFALGLVLLSRRRR